MNWLPDSHRKVSDYSFHLSLKKKWRIRQPVTLEKVGSTPIEDAIELDSKYREQQDLLVMVLVK